MSQRNDFTTFWLAKNDLPFFLEPHEFYVLEARNRLLSQFSDVNIAQETRVKEEQYLDLLKDNFNPEYYDPANAYEQAHDAAISHAWSLLDMQNTVSLALTAGMYHQFDKRLREKVIREFSNWLERKVVSPIIWEVNHPRLIELLEWVGIEITGKDFADKIDACRLVVNVYKHGDGDSHRELSSRYPEYYPSSSVMDCSTSPPQHDDLRVTESQFIEFADAITAFWKNIPEYCFHSQLQDEPNWLEAKYIKVQKKLK